MATEAQYVATADGLPTKPTEVATPDWYSEKFFKQRSSHRAVLFWFAIIMSIISFFLLGGIIGFQTYVRLFWGNPSFQVISDQGLQILSVSVFGQFLGIVYVIAK